MLASRARSLFSRSFATASGKGVRITQFGDWSSSLAQVEVPVAAPAAGQVSVKFQAAPINPADLDVIAGTYGKLPKLPHFAGLEGVAVVDAVGAGAKLKVGQRVIPAHPGFGTWRSHAVAEESAFLPVASDIPIEYSAVLSVNPCSAYRMLEDFVSLKAGDVVVQNAANSMVGQTVIQLCKLKGVKTINLVRSRPDLGATVDYLKSIGGDVVVPEEYVAEVGVSKAFGGLGDAKLGLNAVGGSAALSVTRALGANAKLVTYGSMSRKGSEVPAGSLIFKNISSHGFWMTRWVEQSSVADRVKMLTHLEGLVRDGKLKLLLERASFDEWNSALHKNWETYRDRKVVMLMN